MKIRPGSRLQIGFVFSWIWRYSHFIDRPIISGYRLIFYYLCYYRKYSVSPIEIGRFEQKLEAETTAAMGARFA
jgi:hypothetical protein